MKRFLFVSISLIALTTLALAIGADLFNNAPIATAQAQSYKLSVPFPKTQFNPSGTTEISGPAQYIKTIYGFGLSFGALLAMAMVVIGAVQYTISEAIPSKEDAKERITSAVLGLVLLLSAYIILNTINPVLPLLHEPTLGNLPPPSSCGALICNGVCPGNQVCGPTDPSDPASLCGCNNPPPPAGPPPPGGQSPPLSCALDSSIGLNPNPAPVSGVLYWTVSGGSKNTCSVWSTPAGAMSVNPSSSGSSPFVVSNDTLFEIGCSDSDSGLTCYASRKVDVQ